MLRLTTVSSNKNPDELKQSISDLRKTFANVFSLHYTKRLAPSLKNALDAKEVKAAEDLKQHTNPVLRGFSDLLVKKKFFDKELKEYANPAELQKTFHKIYHGAGFDDEEALLLAFHDLKFNNECKSAEDHYEKIKTRLKPDDQAEVKDYLDVLQKANRQLRSVNYLALIDDSKIVHGFIIFHILQSESQPILHVRQAAMREQGRGYAGLMTRYLIDHYPKAIYEANQRKANLVLMKKNLAEEKLIQETTAVLGYNSEYYLGLRGNQPILDLFLAHSGVNLFKKPTNESKSAIDNKKIGLLKFGNFAEAESIPQFFSPTKLCRDSFALKDDNFCKDKVTFLRSSRSKIF